MNLLTNKTTGKLGLLAAAALLLTATGMAEAARVIRVRRRPVRVVRPVRPVRPAPRPVVVRPKVVKPAPVIKVTPRPVVTVATTPAPAVKVVVPAGVTYKAYLRSEIARLKNKYATLDADRTRTAAWLAGPGKYYPTVDRAKKQLRLANLNEECTEVAQRIVELEAALANA